MTKEERLKAAEAAIVERYDIPLKELRPFSSERESAQGFYNGFIKGAEAEAESKWVSVLYEPPPFDEAVLVWCEVYGRYIATHVFLSELDGVKYGNWHNGKELGVLPPIYWQPIPTPPLNQQQR